VAPCEKREYGKAVVTQIITEGGASSSTTTITTTTSSPLLEGLPQEFDVWMSHGDKLHEVPVGFRAVGE
jgi:GMP synthase (glutamine-hydrolysing)